MQLILALSVTLVFSRVLRKLPCEQNSCRESMKEILFAGYARKYCFVGLPFTCYLHVLSITEHKIKHMAPSFPVLLQFNPQRLSLSTQHKYYSPLFHDFILCILPLAFFIFYFFIFLWRKQNRVSWAGVCKQTLIWSGSPYAHAILW